MNEPLWTFPDFLAATNATGVGVAPSGVTGISIDSRTLAPGEAFFAIAGDRFDGHDFVAAALKAGASTAVVAEERAADAGHLSVVADPLEALRGLARAARARSQASVVAVTGSVGKTGTKEMLAVALGASGPTHASPASFNNHWGVPLTLSRLPAGARFAVFEIGMNHAGEITPLTEMVRPDVAIVTTVEPVHLEHFDSVEGIARAKGEIFSGVVAGGAALINRDNPHFDLLAEMAGEAGVERVIGFGEHQDAELRLTEVRLKPEVSVVSASVFGEAVTFKLRAPGRHVVQNSLAVLGAVSLLGADLARAMLALADIEPPEGRGRRYRLTLVRGTATVIDESYNANPASMRAAIHVLAGSEVAAGGRRIAVLGDMLELGEGSPDLHAGLAEDLDKSGIDLVFAAGPLMRNLWEALPTVRRGGYAKAAGGLTDRILEALVPGDVVMVKGSNGSRLAPIVAAMREHFAPDDTDRTSQGEGA